MNQKKSKKTQHTDYINCLLGRVGVPTDKRQLLLFQIMMVFAMVTIMVTTNWIISTTEYSWSSFTQILALYPIMFAIAFAVRMLIANPIVDAVTKKYILPNLTGLPRTLAISLANVLTMASTVMFFRLLVLHGGFQDFYPAEYFNSLPIAYLMGFTISYFLVTPLMKLAFVKQIGPRLDARKLAAQEQ